MLLTIGKDSLGFEARIRGNTRDDIAAGSGPTMKAALEALRFAVVGLPIGKRRDAALALINNV